MCINVQSNKVRYVSMQYVENSERKEKCFASLSILSCFSKLRPPQRTKQSILDRCHRSFQVSSLYGAVESTWGKGLLQCSDLFVGEGKGVWVEDPKNGTSDCLQEGKKRQKPQLDSFLNFNPRINQENGAVRMPLIEKLTALHRSSFIFRLSHLLYHR